MHILLADDHVLFSEALNQFIKALKPEWTMEMVETLDEAIDKMEIIGIEYDLVMLDFRMPGMDGLNGLKKIRNLFPYQKTAIISGLIEPEMVNEAMDMGACAYLPKTLTGKRLVRAIDLVMSGERFVPLKDTGTEIMPSYQDDSSATIDRGSEYHKKRHHILASLTKRETEVMTYLAQGLSNKEIAKILDLQVPTVKLHISGICRKIDVDNRTKAALAIHDLKLIAPLQSMRA